MRALHFPIQYRVFCLSLVVVVVGAMLSMAAVPVHAQGLALLACTGTSSARFNPGITYTLQDVMYTGDDTFACTPPLGDTELTGGTAHVSVASSPLTCSLLVAPGPEDRVMPYNWNDGEQSVITYTLAAVVMTGGDIVITETGSVTSGSYEGATSTLVTTLFDSVLDNCATGEGQVSVAGQTTLTILPLPL